MNARIQFTKSSPSPSERLDAQVDDKLARWHFWRSGYKVGSGHRGSDATCRDAQSDYHYHDRDNGVVDDRNERQMMEGVERAWMDIPVGPKPWRRMVEIEAASVYHGVQQTSPELPQDPEEFEVLRIEARNKMIRAMYRHGCIGV